MAGKSALKRLETAAAKSPDDGGAQIDLALAYEDAGRTDDALLVWRRAAVAGAADGDHIARCAGALYRLGDWDRALGMARIALSMGESVPCLCVLAQILQAMGHTTRARQRAQTAVDREPDNLHAQAILATIVGNLSASYTPLPDNVENGRCWSVRLTSEDG